MSEEIITETPFYLEGKKIWKRPIKQKTESGSMRITCGFPVCVVSEFADENDILAIFNKHAD